MAITKAEIQSSYDELISKSVDLKNILDIDAILVGTGYLQSDPFYFARGKVANISEEISSGINLSKYTIKVAEETITMILIDAAGRIKKGETMVGFGHLGRDSSNQTSIYCELAYLVEGKRAKKFVLSYADR